MPAPGTDRPGLIARAKGIYFDLGSDAALVVSRAAGAFASEFKHDQSNKGILVFDAGRDPDCIAARLTGRSGFSRSDIWKYLFGRPYAHRHIQYIRHYGTGPGF